LLARLDVPFAFNLAHAATANPAAVLDFDAMRLGQFQQRDVLVAFDRDPRFDEGHFMPRSLQFECSATAAFGGLRRTPRAKTFDTAGLTPRYFRKSQIIRAASSVQMTRRLPRSITLTFIRL